MAGFVVTYKLADTLGVALLSPFLVELGFTNTDIAAVSKLFGRVSVVLGSLLAGGGLVKFGVYRSLWFFGIFQALGILTFVGLSFAGKSYPWLVASIVAENFSSGMGTTAFLAFLMGICDQRFSATQYALLTSFMALARTVVSAGAGAMVKALGWPTFFGVCVACAGPGLALLPKNTSILR